METYYNHLNKKTRSSSSETTEASKIFTPQWRTSTILPKDKKKLKLRRNELLKHGLNYSIEKPTATYFTNLLEETERAIKLLDGKMQNIYCILATNKLKQIINSTSKKNSTQKDNYMWWKD
jgi:hypothetical protein